MSNKKMILAFCAGTAIAGGVIGWLMSDTINIDAGKGVKIQTNSKMINTVITRDKDGEKLWEFHVAEMEQDKKGNKAYLKTIKGKVFRKDKSYIDIVADAGEVTLNKSNNNFMVRGNVKAIRNTGGKLYADRVTYREKDQFVQATGKVRFQKDEYVGFCDIAETTTALEKFKLKGHAKVEKGGKFDDK